MKIDDYFKRNLSINKTIVMYSTTGSSMSTRDSYDFYDFETEDNFKKWKNILLTSLEQIQKKVHPGLRANMDALQYVEGLILRLLSNLIHNQLNNVADVEERVKRLFPYPLDRWAISKAQETIVLLKTHKKQKSLTADQLPIRMPVERLHQLLQKEVFGHKIDIQITQYLVAILEYIAADIFQLAGHYVKNIRHEEIYCQDIKVAMCADKVLMDMFYPDEDVSLNSNLNEDLCEQKRRTSVTYDEVVKDLIHEEKQFIRDLNLIIKVFRDPFVKILPEKELEKIFFNIDDIYDFSVNFLGSIEDALEVAEDSCPTAVGSCFEELAECAEFDVYEKYAQDIMSNSCRDRLYHWLSDPTVASTLSTTGHGMILALKYVLPKLLIGPVYHCLSYFKYIELFKDLTTSDEDKESFEQAEGLLMAPLKNDLERVCKRNARPGEGYLRLYGRTNRAAALTKMSELQRSIDGWEGKDIGQFCNEFVMDGPLGKLSGTSARSGRITERHVFLFDGLMVLCKPNNKRSSMTVAVTGGGGGAQCEWRLKEKYLIRNIEIIDREDYSESDISATNGFNNNNNSTGVGTVQHNGQHNVPKYAFEIVPRNQTRIILFAKSPEEKALWMSNLILLNTRSMLERTLDSMLTDEAKKHPLRLPSPDVYRFAVEDSDSNIIFEESKSNTNVPLIKGATLLKLVERLTYHMYADPMFVRTFLTTYRSFCTPQTLLDLLIERFEIPEPPECTSSLSSGQTSILSLNNSINNNYFFNNNNNFNNNNEIQYNNSSLCCYNNVTDGQSYSLGAGGQQIYENTEIRNNHREILKRFRKEYSQPVQFRVLNVLRHWIDNHYYDFERDSHLLDTLKKFLDEKVKAKKNMRKWCENIKKVLDRKSELSCGEPHITHSFERQPPNPEWWLTKDPEKFDLLTLHPIELARQLTLLEFELYRAVKPSELVGTEGQFGVWTKKDKQKTSPNLLKMIHHTSNFTFWLEKCIVEAENFEERVAIMSRIIEIMIVLQELNNFNGVLEVISAMGSACVHRLEHTMSYIERNSKLKRALDDAQELSVDHFKRYHEKLRSINPPCVPFFGMYLTNILHIEEGNPDCLVSPHQSLSHYDSQSTLTSLSSNMSSAQTTNTSLLSLNSSNMSCASTATVHSSPSSISTTGSVSSIASTSVPNTPNANTSQVLINFSKRRKVAEITGEIQQYQNQPYCLTVVPEIRHFLESLNPLGDLDEKELNDYLYSRSLEIEPRGSKQLNKFPRRWPELSLKSPGIKPRGSRGHHLPALQSLDSLLNSLSNSQIEESVDDSQTHSPSTPQTPPYSATSCGGGSDHSVFAPVFIGGGSTYSGPSPTTPIHSTPPTPPAWSSMSSMGLPPNPSTPPPLPPRTMRPRNSASFSSDLSSPRSRFAPTFVPMANSYEDQSPPPLPPRCQTFSTLPRNSSHSGTADRLVGNVGGHPMIQRLNSEITLPRRNSALDLHITQPQLPRRFSQSSQQHGPMSPPPPPPNSTTVFLPPVMGPCPQLPPKTYRQTLNNIAR